ncbi:helix-turn-helix transcriptional regulator [Aldersonia sp. NBC_00410]|uniref:winged helix-turn-helix transcriptional regulator n=1 Tax=Aldersonia sp. NBC_00410 TaxID=2975954 RepID=UPI00225AE71B|nr:helix-turn-helix domain-containing protein [Aldersonia sp. NBC_00410]MCX5044905.1 helix-turn-helix transcriptional regulator [Aldersonia sp. NBC_00410]
MAKRSYQQYCGLAAALDLLGERWTVLIVRDLLVGPKRFTDLLERLPGIGTGLLSQRLRELDSAGVIEKATLPPPAASTVYQLTPDGEGLRPALLSLIRWGSKRLGPPTEGQRIDAESLALGLAARYEPDASVDADGVYGLVLDNEHFQVRIADRHIEILAKPAEGPRAVFTTDSTTLIALNNEEVALADALADKAIVVSGAPDAIHNLAVAFGLLPASPL